MTQIIDCPPSERPARSGVDFTAIKAKQKAVWGSGDYAVIGTTLQIVGESLCETLNLAAGSRVLDVACGNGNATLAAARRFCDVTGLDYVPALFERARERARAERLELEFVEGDAEALPFPDASFDVALSAFGVMFAPDQARAASELLRVVRPGGSIGLASWTPDGFIGKLLERVTAYVPPPAGVASPAYWGTDERLAELFPSARSIKSRRTTFAFRYTSARHFIDVFRRFYGPTHRAFAVLGAAEQERLSADIERLIVEYARPAGRSLAIPGLYLETVIER
jgi:ubiquinone/menaquinone biosynthesis C-methylase UbiE